jgi:hypothetical protein
VRSSCLSVFEELLDASQSWTFDKEFLCESSCSEQTEDELKQIAKEESLAMKFPTMKEASILTRSECLIAYSADWRSLKCRRGSTIWQNAHALLIRDSWRRVLCSTGIEFVLPNEFQSFIRECTVFGTYCRCSLALALLLVRDPFCSMSIPRCASGGCI